MDNRWAVGKQALAAPVIWCVLAVVGWAVRGKTYSRREFLVSAAVAGALVLALDFGRIVATAKSNLHPNPRVFPHYFSWVASTWVAKHTSPEAIIMADQDGLIHYETGHKTVHFPITSDVDAILQRIRANRVRYLVAIDSPTSFFRPPERERIRLLLQRYPGTLRLEYQAGYCRIFDVLDR
jgi:hypothetical protein